MDRSAVDEIKARLPIDEVIGSYIKLEKSGKSLKARCPFHNEKTPSFYVSPDRGGYYCFGCNAKGDIFTFVQQFEGLDFRGALKILAEKAGVTLHFDAKADGDRDKMYAAMEEAAKYFEEQYTKSREAQEYIKGRGINENTRKLFRIGWAPDGWRNILAYMKGKGYAEAILEKVGLIKRKDGGDDIHGNNEAKNAVKSDNHYDRFRGRIMFPISDSGGRVIAFSGRILYDDGKSAKYLNSPDTPLYDKSAVLYGLDKAKNEIRRLNYSIFVEGQMDLVMSHQAGIRNTVAASGTALGEEVERSDGAVSNIGLVRRLSPNVIIAFDADSAGRKAALRAASIALSLGMDVKVADIKGGKDPADLVRENVENWKEVLRSAKPVIEFELNNVLNETTDPRKVPKAINEKILPLLANVGTVGEQSYFVQMISERARIPIDAIWQDLRSLESKMKTGNVRRENETVGDDHLKRIDLIERRLFGLVFLLKEHDASAADDVLGNMKKIAETGWEEKSGEAEKNKSDLLFEAEAYFGSDKENWLKFSQELLNNFEADTLNERLIEAMQDLRNAEKAGDKQKAEELAKKCQALSIRKAEITRRKN